MWPTCAYKSITTQWAAAGNGGKTREGTWPQDQGWICKYRALCRASVVIADNWSADWTIKATAHFRQSWFGAAIGTLQPRPSLPRFYLELEAQVGTGYGAPLGNVASFVWGSHREPTPNPGLTCQGLQLDCRRDHTVQVASFPGSTASTCAEAWGSEATVQVQVYRCGRGSTQLCLLATPPIPHQNDKIAHILLLVPQLKACVSQGWD
jgi:hypothetical protein